MYSIILFFILSTNGENLTWFGSISKCNLANLEEVNTQNNTFPRSWIGGYLSTSPWMAYQGCYSTSDDIVDEKHFLTDNSPVKCNELCKGKDYFALKISLCTCIDDISMLGKLHTKHCSVNCSIIKCDVNISTSAMAVFVSSQGLKGINPKGSRNQKWLCTVSSFKNGSNEAVLNATNCQQKKGIVCQFANEVEIYGPDRSSNENAKQLCDIAGFNKTYGEHLEADHEFWTNIQRYYIINWINSSSELLNITSKPGKDRRRMCVSAEKLLDAHTVNISPLPCKTHLSSICSSIGDIGQGQNESTETYSVSLPSTNSDKNKKMVTKDEIRGQKTTESYDLSILSPEVYALQLVFVLGLSVAVLFLTVMSLYTYRKNYRSVDLLANQMTNSCFMDPSVSTNTVAFPRHSALYSFGSDPELPPPPAVYQEWHKHNKDGSNQEKSGDNGYHHIDFTMKSDGGQNFVGNQYGVPITQAIPENDYEHPWESRPMKIMSNIRQSFRKGTNAVRNSFFQPQNNLQNPSKSEEVAYMDVTLDNPRFLYDTPAVNAIDESTC